MLNEPVGEGSEMGAAGEEGSSVNYIQVTPQEKEAIERVCEEGRVMPACCPHPASHLFFSSV